ncbi:MAG: tRNA (adenosine(37)-N6)-dimethylallyltransferase, partial [Flavobacteriaceae bacterium]
RALEVFLTSGKPYSSYLRKPKAARSFNTIYIGLYAERPVVYQRIEQRVDLMMQTGLLDEARNLIDYRSTTALQTVGYQELFKYLDGLWDLETAVGEIKKNTRRFAKRQLTWFRKNKSIIWVDHKDALRAVVNKIEILMNEAEND